MNAREASELGNRVAALIETGRATKACALLTPVLAKRTPFPTLERIGAAVGVGRLATTNAFLKQIAAEKTMGGWVVIGGALRAQLERDLAGAFARCRNFVIAADTWYATDILAERVPGPALVTEFQPALSLLTLWRENENRWVRRMVGVAIHFWAKRSRGAPECIPQAKTLLTFLEPMFAERNTDAIKGVGWGLKTLGHHYPDLVADWLAVQVVCRGRPHRALMLRKAMTYLSRKQRARATRVASR